MQIETVAPTARLATRERDKLQRKLAKIQRILPRGDSLRAHATLSRQRHLCEAEVTLRALRHTLVVTGRGSTEFVALQAALDKLEKQAMRNKRKIIDTHRPGRQRGRPSPVTEASIGGYVPAEQSTEPPARPQIVRSPGAESKPMTAEGALLALEDGDRDYVAYRDLDTNRLNVLIRRRDGTVELVEGG